MLTKKEFWCLRERGLQTGTYKNYVTFQRDLAHGEALELHTAYVRNRREEEYKNYITFQRDLAHGEALERHTAYVRNRREKEYEFELTGRKI